jgi:4-amino-4-deoxy-L-arabinose transferase-like glycosyltransferase
MSAVSRHAFHTALRHPALHILVVLAVSLIVNLPGVGSSGLSDSEGFRAIPAWELAATGDPLITTLFQQPYLRKPPGTVWAIAVSSSLLGQTELAARAVSVAAAALSAMAVALFSFRRFGAAAGLAAGLAYSLTPWMWRWARAAEIEALHNLFVLIACLAVVSLATTTRRIPWAAALSLTLSSAAMLLTKGPAGLAVIGGVGFAAVLLVPSRRWLWWALPALALAAAVFATWLVLLWARVRLLPEPPVLEPPSRFLWRPGQALAVLTLVPVVLLSATPFSFALLPALLGPRFATMPPPAARADLSGRIIAWGVLAALGILTLAGVSNNRYALPVVTLLPVTYAFALWRHANRDTPAAQALGRAVLLHRGSVVMPVLLGAALLHAAWFEHRRETRTSGRAAGLALGAHLPPGETWADALADSRPEVLWYAQQHARSHGTDASIRWIPGLATRADWGGHPLAVLASQSTDPTRPPEIDPRALHAAGYSPAFSGTAHVFEFTLFLPPAAGGEVK